MNRNELIERAETEFFDIAIIGGGITGAGILYNAVERGLKVILIDKNDFASGTSSRSSKMIHGGLRYLQYGQFSLVREALLERAHLLKKFPNWVKPIPYIIPHTGSFLGFLFKFFGIQLYQFLAGKNKDIPKGRFLKAKEFLDLIPNYRADKLWGGSLYYDCATNDSRLTIGTISECSAQGAVALNYLTAVGTDSKDGAIQSLICEDRETNQTLKIRARVFINASGAWTDRVLTEVLSVESKRMQPTQGIHVIISKSRLPKDLVSVVKVKDDGRYIYSLPWEDDLTILGTTDTNFNGNLSKIHCDIGDVNYIIKAFNETFSNLNLTLKDVISVYPGLRPLLRDDQKSNSSRSREYDIWWTRKNWLNIAGGKLTSFLSMGNRCLEIVYNRFHELKKEPRSFLYKYDIREMGISEDEVLFCVQSMFARRVEDILTRRTTTTFSMRSLDEPLVRKVATWMAQALHHDLNWIEKEVRSYQSHWKEYHPDYLAEL